MKTAMLSKSMRKKVEGLASEWGVSEEEALQRLFGPRQSADPTILREVEEVLGQMGAIDDRCYDGWDGIIPCEGCGDTGVKRVRLVTPFGTKPRYQNMLCDVCGGTGKDPKSFALWLLKTMAEST